MSPLDTTHDPARRSWLESANAANADFPVQNLPFAVYAPDRAGDWRIGVAIGDRILDLRAAVHCGAIGAAAPGLDTAPLCADSLDPLLACGHAAWRRLRLALCGLLSAGSAWQPRLGTALHDPALARFRVPARVGDYTDFFTSIHHAARVGELLRPEQPLLPNYKWLPIAYHGRASSILISGTPVVRPWGQLAARGATEPRFAPSARLDYELELAAFIGPGNALGSPIGIGQAEEHVFGLCLLNDWSARDIQAWEYQPLGPFLGKSFGTSVSPWVVTLDALQPFRSPWLRAPDDPAPLPYLDDPTVRRGGALDITLAVQLRSAAMRAAGLAAVTVSTSNARDAYWCLAQLVAHHTVAGCNLRAGDLLATGTQSGPLREQSGCLLELTQGGSKALALPDGSQRRFLEDGDEVTLRAWCERGGARRIGFGDCTGTVLPAIDTPR